jgi:hypothetical protein
MCVPVFHSLPCAIVSYFTYPQILYELVSSFSNLYPEMEEEALCFAWENWVRRFLLFPPFLPMQLLRSSFPFFPRHCVILLL